MQKSEKQRKLIAKQYKEIEEHHVQMINILQKVIVNRHIETMSHLMYVEAYSRILAVNYGILFPYAKLTRKKVNLIAEASKMHDVGKIAMPDVLIQKKGKYSKPELDSVMEHTIQGGEIMEMISDFRNDDYSRIGYNICKYHHARYDGTGYPKGIKGIQIPLEAQIVSLADEYDILANRSVNNRVYSKDEVYDILIDGRCGILSQEMQECFKLSKEAMEAVEINV